ncbi:MAG: ABC transporter permease [Nitrospinota bacterium]
MRIFNLIVKKELLTYFSSPIAYSVILIFTLISGTFCYTLVYLYGTQSFEIMRNAQFLGTQELTIGDHMVRPLFNNLAVILMMIIPLLTMRLFAEEQKSGSIEYLFTWPIKNIELLMGKFVAAFTLFLLMLLLTTPFFIYVSFFASLPVGHITLAYLGLILLGAGFISLGLFISSLTENQIVAAVITFGASILLWIINWTFSDYTGYLGSLSEYLSLVEHLDNFAKGTLDSRSIVYYISFILTFLFLTLRSLEVRN